MLGHPLAATIGDSARCMQNLEKVLFTGPKTSDNGDVYLRLGLNDPRQSRGLIFVGLRGFVWVSPDGKTV